MLGLLEFFIFMCIFGYFIGKNRTTTMIDIITTRFHEAYTWINPPEHERQHRENFIREQHIMSNKKFHDDHQRKSLLVNGKDIHASNGKVQTLTDVAAELSDGLICQDCARNENRTSQMSPIKRALAAVDLLKMTQLATTGSKFDWGIYFPHIVQNLRLKFFEYRPMFDKVFNHKHVRNEIERVAKNMTRESEVEIEDEDVYFEDTFKKCTERAHALLTDMRCTLSDKLLRLTSYVLYKLLPVFLDGVFAHPAQIEMIKVAQKKMPNTPLIFLPLHRSHLDYILVTFILLNHDIKPPQVAAGDNLNIPVFGYLLRGLGAFYIKRKIDGPDGKKDYIYRSLLQAYVQESICEEHNIEFFIEGGRTRTGKPNMPKSGILSVIVEAFIDGLIEDAILVPVSMNYEKLVDGNFVREQMGTPKKKESFRFAMRSIWKILNSKFGFMRIDFNEPFSLKELVKSFKERENPVGAPHPPVRKLLSGPSANSMYGIEVIDKHRELVDNIARHLVFDSSNATCVMSTNALAYLLLNKYRNGATLKELSMSLTTLRLQIGTEKEFGFEGESDKVVLRAARLLGSSMVEQTVQPNGEIFIRPILQVPNVIETAYYANTFTPYFALDSVVATAIAGSVNEGASMELNDIVDTAMTYCDILRYEFIFYKPCQHFPEQIEKSVHRLCRLGILQQTSDGFSLNLKSAETLLTTLAPFSVTYLSVVECLRKLFEASQMLEKDFLTFCLANLSEKFEAGEITYGESISTDSIKNCLKVMEKWTVVEGDSLSGVRVISLNPLYNSLAGVQSVVDKVEKFVILK